MRTQIANILFIIAGCLWGVEVIPQIFKTIKRKSVGDISLFFYCACLVAYIIFMIAGYLINNIYLMISHIPSLIFITIMLILIIKYREKNTEIICPYCKRSVPDKKYLTSKRCLWCEDVFNLK